MVSLEAATARSYDGELRVISVGRLDAEKNPLLIADVLRRLVDDGRPWRLIVCGDALRAALAEARLRELGVEERAELPGYVPYGPRLIELYRSSHALLHTSWTEGLPQVLIEAFAAGVPAVATDVGGIRDAVGEAARLVPPGDPAAAAELEAIAGDPALRRRLIEAGHVRRRRTASAEVSRVAEFLRGCRVSGARAPAAPGPPTLLGADSLGSRGGDGEHCGAERQQEPQLLAELIGQEEVHRQQGDERHDYGPAEQRHVGVVVDGELPRGPDAGADGRADESEEERQPRSRPAPRGSRDRCCGRSVAGR